MEARGRAEALGPAIRGGLGVGGRWMRGSGSGEGKEVVEGVLADGLWL